MPLPPFNLKKGQWDIAGFHDLVMSAVAVNPA